MRACRHPRTPPMRCIGRGPASLAATPRHPPAAHAEFRARSLAGGAPYQGRTALASLTARQLHVLELLSSGASTVEIARRLAISPTTVRRHVSSLMARLGVDGRAGAIEAYRAADGAATGREGLPRGSRGVV